MTSNETLCTGCGATVTMQGGRLRDSEANARCPNGYHWHTIAVSLPPVAIAPEPQHTPKWETNKIIYPAGQDVSFEVLDESCDIVCQTIMREVATEKERIAVDAQRINLFAAAPDMLAALKAIKKELQLSGNWDARDYGWPANRQAIDAAISKAEDFMEEARRTR